MTPVCCLVDGSSPLASAFEGTGLESLLVTPIKYQEKVLGYLSLFRSPQLVERSWVGKYDPDERHYQPRKSFEIWIEQYQTTCPWQPEVLQMAQEVAMRLYSVLVQQGCPQTGDPKVCLRLGDPPAGRKAVAAFSGLSSCFILARKGAEMAVGILGLDRFKVVNESMGHSAGDVLLSQVAERLRSHLNHGIWHLLFAGVGTMARRWFCRGPTLCR